MERLSVTGAGALHVFLTTADDPDTASVAPLLSEADQARLTTFPPDRAERLVRGRRALAWAVARLAPASAVTLEQRCPHCGGAHGAPLLVGAPLVASMTHVPDASILAVADAREIAAIGVDVEERAQPPGRLAAIAELTGSDGGLRHWTRVEAVLKADGRGLRVDPSRVRIGASAGGAAAATVDGADAVYEVRDVEAPAGLIATVAVRFRPGGEPT